VVPAQRSLVLGRAEEGNVACFIELIHGVVEGRFGSLLIICPNTRHSIVEVSWEDHVVHALDLPVRAGLRHGGPIDADVVFIVESEELLLSELRTIVRDNGVWDPKVMDDVKEEQHGLLELDRGDRLSLYPLCKLIYSDNQVRIAPGHPLEGSD